MSVSDAPDVVRVACDAMCGGVARWLRVLGVDATYTPGIDDGALVRHALTEQRIVISSDGRLFERRALVTGAVRGLRLPVGLKRLEQVRWVVRALGIRPGFPRCARCNGALAEVPRADVGDVVPARSLVWATRFWRCGSCRQVFWEGTHWHRIRCVLAEMQAGTSP